MLGAMQAGMAFSNASVALVHGMARPLGACFHLTHGLSIAVLLPVVTEFSLSAAPERYARIAAEMGAADVVAGIRELNRDVAIPSLRQLGHGGGSVRGTAGEDGGGCAGQRQPGEQPTCAERGRDCGAVSAGLRGGNGA